MRFLTITAPLFDVGSYAHPLGPFVSLVLSGPLVSESVIVPTTAPRGVVVPEDKVKFAARQPLPGCAPVQLDEGAARPNVGALGRWAEASGLRSSASIRIYSGTTLHCIVEIR
jgi:hypothetical protein